MGIDRRIAQKYRKWAKAEGLLDMKKLPSVEEIYKRLEAAFPTKLPPKMESSVELWRELVTKLREGGVEIAAIYQRLSERGYEGSYEAVRRFVRKIEPKPLNATVRVECEPGEGAQVDFGYAGK